MLELCYNVPHDSMLLYTAMLTLYQLIVPVLFVSAACAEVAEKAFSEYEPQPPVMGMPPAHYHDQYIHPDQYAHPPPKRQRMDISGNTDQDDSMSGGSGDTQQHMYAGQGFPSNSRVIETDCMEDGYKWVCFGAGCALAQSRGVTHLVNQLLALLSLLCLALGIGVL